MQLKLYDVIYADPPWSYKNKRTGGSSVSGAGIHYKVMDLEDIKNLFVPAKKKRCAIYVGYRAAIARSF